MRIDAADGFHTERIGKYNRLLSVPTYVITISAMRCLKTLMLYSGKIGSYSPPENSASSEWIPRAPIHKTPTMKK
jgi:hypothetical protein